MVILDTNVVSEITRIVPSPNVLDWVDGLDAIEIYVTAITKAEIKFGLQMMPEGKRRRELETKYEKLFSTLLFRKVLPFDDSCTASFAHFAAGGVRRGRISTTADLQIAAIAHSFNATLATRNVSDFDYEELELINPWLQ